MDDVKIEFRVYPQTAEYIKNDEYTKFSNFLINLMMLVYAGLRSSWHDRHTTHMEARAYFIR